MNGHNKNKTKIMYGNAGQALLFVVVALTISTVVGVAVATRTLSVTKRVSSTDTYAKVYYAAEAGIERFINRPAIELLSLANNEGTYCSSVGASHSSTTGNCVFTLGQDTSIPTVTEVDVTFISYNESTPSNHYSVGIRDGAFSTIYLAGYSGSSVRVCWKGKLVSTALYYTLWSNSALMSKGLYLPTPPASLLPSIKTTGTTTASNYSGYYSGDLYKWCFSVSPVTNAAFLNVMSVGGESTVAFFPVGGDLPNQGFRIISKASLAQGSQIQVTKIIESVKSFNHAPGFFDSAIYAQGDIEVID